VATLFYLVHYVRGMDFVTVGQFSEIVNQILIQSGERMHLEPRKVGAILTSLGLAQENVNCAQATLTERPKRLRISRAEILRATNSPVFGRIPYKKRCCMPSSRNNLGGEPRGGLKIKECLQARNDPRRKDVFAG
jgi:hypothetical protein